jgi:hypothetical protein
VGLAILCPITNQVKGHPFEPIIPPECKAGGVVLADQAKSLDRKNVMENPVSKNGIPIRVTDKQWAHVVESHDYMAGTLDLVVETIEDPDYIAGGRRGEVMALRHYEATSISEKFVVAVYRELTTDGFLITAFMTSQPQTILRKGVLWQKLPIS